MSYFGLIDVRISVSEKEQPVLDHFSSNVDWLIHSTKTKDAITIT